VIVPSLLTGWNQFSSRVKYARSLHSARGPTPNLFQVRSRSGSILAVIVTWICRLTSTVARLDHPCASISLIEHEMTRHAQPGADGACVFPWVDKFRMRRITRHWQRRLSRQRIRLRSEVKVERRSDSSISTFDPSLNRQNADEPLSILPKKGDSGYGPSPERGSRGWPKNTGYIDDRLFSLVTSTGLIGVPLFGYVHGYTKLDWALAGALYIISGLGITVGYHRMISHHSFRCPNWVKVVFLVAGSWAMENSALKWGANHARHHARVDQEEDPYNAMKGFWYSHCVWFFMKSPYRRNDMHPGCARIPL
jgi:hypothetical protein